ncbi:unnamed protein product [Adineta ricciae]|uniref:VWFA domain-containing protein n=1 Tax=Adineta ricciae TaxID=249248 RepID=A0A814RKL0_ADIRI|nr:unnamed protein product [Adineta ricciae]
MDVTICIVDASGITVGPSRFSNIISAVLNLKSTTNDIRTGFVVPRPLNQMRTANFDNIQNMEQFTNWYNSIPGIGTNTVSYGAEGFGLDETLRMQWRQGDAVKKLVILFTDRVPDCLSPTFNGYDLWDIPRQLRNQEITLISVGLDTNAMKCEDFFWALSIKTGGIFLSLDNAGRILPEIIQQAMDGEVLCAAYHDKDVINIMSDIDQRVAWHENRAIHELPNPSPNTLCDREDISKRVAKMIKYTNMDGVRTFYSSMPGFLDEY